MSEIVDLRRPEVIEFIETVWPDREAIVCAKGALVIFSLPAAEALGSSSPGELADAAVRWSREQREVYIGVAAMSAASVTRRRRGRIEDAVLVPGLVADLDVVARDRKKPNLFASLDEAHTALAQVVVPPSVVVATGGGVHAWWLYREPLLLTDPDEQRQAQLLASRFRDHLQSIAGRAGRVVDSVYDLTRVLRLPGTLNWKRAGGDPALAAPVKMLPLEGERPRYQPSELIDLLPPAREELGPRAGAGSTVVGELVFDPDANPPLEKFEALRANDERFAATIEHRRKDLKDQSLSGYDMALANAAVGALWTDQEVANLMIYHRRRYRGDLKMRENYYQNTIRNAREGMAISELTSEIASAGGLDQEDPETPGKVLRFFSNATGAPLRRVLVYVPERKQITMEFEDGRAMHTTLDEIFMWDRFWRALRRAGFSPKPSPPKREVWLALVNGLYEIAEEIEVEASGPVAIVAAMIIELARGFNADLDARIEANEDQRALAIMKNGAFIREGVLWVRLAGLARIAEERKMEGEYRDVVRIRAVVTKNLGGTARNFTARVSARIEGAAGPRRVKEDEPQRERQIGGTLYGVDPEHLRRAVDASTGDVAEHENKGGTGERKTS